MKTLVEILDTITTIRAIILVVAIGGLVTGNSRIMEILVAGLVGSLVPREEKSLVESSSPPSAPVSPRR